MVQVLIVDDDRNCREVLRLALTEDGYEVESAENYGRAVELARSANPEILITDYWLGEARDGADVARAIQKLSPSVRVIAISAAPMDQVRRGFSDIKTVAILAKPIEIAELETIIHDAISNPPKIA